MEDQEVEHLGLLNEDEIHSSSALNNAAVTVFNMLLVDSNRKRDDVEKETSTNSGHDKEFRIGGQIADELQEYITINHSSLRDKILNDRRSLVRERLYIETKLGLIRKDLTEDDQVDSDDETFERICERALEQTEITAKNVDQQMNRLEIASDESNWLHTMHHSNKWHEIGARREYSTEHIEKLRFDQKLANLFFESFSEKEKALESVRLNDTIDLISKSQTKALILEICDEMLKSICSEIINTLKYFQRKTTKIVLQSISDVIDEVSLISGVSNAIIAKSKSKLNGNDEFTVLRGSLETMREEHYHRMCRQRSHSQMHYYNIRQSQQFTYSDRDSLNTMNLSNLNKFKVKCDTTIPLHHSWERVLLSKDARNVVWDEIRLEGLRRHEMSIFSMSSDQDQWRPPLLLPEKIGKVTCLKVFPRRMNNTSIIAIGTTLGRIAMWSVPWNKSKSTLLIVTPELPKSEVSNIVEIQTSCLQCDQFVTWSANGHVRVWSMAAKPKKKRFWFFSTKKNWKGGRNYLPMVPTSIFHIQPVDMNVPLQIQSDVVKQIEYQLMPAEARKAMKLNTSLFKNNSRVLALPQLEMHPTFASFLPQLTVLTRHTSILIGTLGGDLMKFNLDYVLHDMDTILGNSKPFVELEYLHPASGADNATIASQAKYHKGNKVFRELFHFHRSKILFIVTLHGLSDTLVTIDADHIMAVWKYNSEQFSGNLWFDPIFTAQLDLSKKVVEVVKEVPNGCPLPDEIKLLVSRHRYRDATSRLCDVFYPVMTHGGLVEYEAQTTSDDYLTYLTNHYTDINKKYHAMTRNFGDGQHNVIWTRKQVKEVILQGTIKAIRPSHDCAEIHFLTTYNNKDGATAAILTFSIENREFIHPYPSFLCSAANKLFGFDVSAIRAESLTKFAWVLDGSQLRCFSLSTAQEFKACQTSPTLSSFQPMFFAQCASFQCMALAAPDDSRIAIADIKLVDEVINNNNEKFYEKSAIAMGYRDSVQHLLNSRFEISRDITEFEVKVEEVAEVCDNNYQGIKVMVDDIVFNEIFAAIDKAILLRRKESNIRELFGGLSGLGVVEPTAWSAGLVNFAINEPEDILKELGIVTEHHHDYDVSVAENDDQTSDDDDENNAIDSTTDTSMTTSNSNSNSNSINSSNPMLNNTNNSANADNGTLDTVF